MEKIKISVPKLEKHLKDNLELHIKEYETAYVKWLDKMAEIYTEAQRRHSKGEKFFIDAPTEPHSHAKEYRRIIAQLDWTVDNAIELDQREFAQFVMDDWEWMRGFKTSTTSSSSSTSSYIISK